MSYNPSNPLIVQSDRTVLLETANDKFEEARDALSVFAEIVKSPEHIHTYRISPLSLWNASALGYTPEQVKDQLTKYSKYEVPDNLIFDINDFMSRYGRIKLISDAGDHWLVSEDLTLLEEVVRQRRVEPFIDGDVRNGRVKVTKDQRGFIKHALIQVGYPVEDLAGYVEGDPLDIALRDTTLQGKDFGLRDYQREAVDAFWAGGTERGGSGTIVLPCGAGKTIVAIGTMDVVKEHTLVLTTNVTALRQWRDEIIDKTDIDPDMVGEYSGDNKEIKPLTITTYQILTYRKSKEDEFKHFGLFNESNWGLIVYDEVHLLPAPVFRAVANLQSRRRLGLTATLVREDGKEDEVFSLIGPKKYDVPWRVLEKKGFIATAQCKEIRVPFRDDDLRLTYALAEPREKYKLAATNPAKLQVIEDLLEEHTDDQVLIIGQYLDQLDDIQELTGAPIITGRTKQADRDVLYKKFRSGEVPVLVVSKVANFAVDLPDANVAIQVSGTFGSRQEEAQRLGRILRPKENGNEAHFYSVVTRDTTEQDYSNKRQLFLTEQGYRYHIETVE
ncbi:DEAD/DEAH box helicase [Persicimonas caeni]|uniref:DNA 3'-5' helicase n=1 Tax=Persicimonas caeni TaxID=2292766 RepID=A0A4Y6PP31_PERCE|nr:DNA repair helicase XPB [Persicimonas caeni]QDG50020.1 DEAD/DEAH box helicase [Persicimonas caeni]QED31241.1 DEAD/DEAH box helicase [Persicimonas caeni]